MMNIFPLHPLQVQQVSEKHYFHSDQPISSIQSYVPESTYELLLQYKKNYGCFHDWNMYWPYIKFHLLQASAEELREIYEVEEGLENRLHTLAIKCDSFTQFMNELKTKRYTWTRLQRILTIFLHISKKKEMVLKENKVAYLRLLGMTEVGTYLFKSFKKGLPGPDHLKTIFHSIIRKLPSIQKQQEFMHSVYLISSNKKRLT